MTLTALSVAAVLSFAYIIVIKYGLRAPSGPEFHSSPVASAATTSAKPEIGFTLLPEARPLPELRFEDGEGGTLTITDFRGKLVLLNIWATWCGPCRREMPTLDHLQAQLGGPDFEVVALSIDRKGWEVVRDFYAEIGVKHLAIYLDQSGKSARALDVAGLPMTLFIDRAGRELGRLVGPAEWDSPEMVKFIRGQMERKSGALGSAASPSTALAGRAGERDLRPQAHFPVAEESK